jgi:hypothetical protein
MSGRNVTGRWHANWRIRKIYNATYIMIVIVNIITQIYAERTIMFGDEGICETESGSEAF